MEPFIFILEIIGTCAFAVSGAVASIIKRLDLFGVLFCGLITALGGGVIRDILLSNLPPVMFCNYIYAFFALGTALTTFIFARIASASFETKAETIDSINNFFDAVGLGVFTIVGINIALSMGYTDNPFFAVFLGMTTGCGGGLLRDIFIREVPFILTKKIYAIASILGGVLYYILVAELRFDAFLSVIIGIAFILILRLLSTYFRWDLPKAIK
ncbi:MAG: trimeric intracellular cation channel family protein [Firmicutes bacterium]|nr:trimeric intracellular cation channel family protein [Bacillota bacterium]